MTTPRIPLCLVVLGLTFMATGAAAQPTHADYDRALALRERYEPLVIGMPEPATWIEDTPRFWYRRSVKDGAEFVVMDAVTHEKRAAFDHALLATRWDLRAETGSLGGPFECDFKIARASVIARGG